MRAVVNGSNELVSAQDYDQWGYLLQSRTYASNESKFKFTEKERDAESNYDYFGARYYDARIGRWGSVDPLQGKEPSKTPYHYTSDNPINKIDPTGLDDIYFKDGVEVDRKVSEGFFGKIGNWLFGDTYYVQSKSGNESYNGNNYFEALSEATVKQFANWDRVFSDWQTSSLEEGFGTRLNDATKDAPANLVDKYFYVLKEANGGKLDQKLNLFQNTLYVYNNIALNYQEAGNTLFGAAIYNLGIDLNIANVGGELFSWKNNFRPDEFNEVQAYKIGYYNFNSNSSFFRNRAVNKFR